MAGRKRRKSALDLVRGAKRFETWRGKRRFGQRIPESLWNLAVELALRHGVSRAAVALKLSYYSLQERIEAQPAPLLGVEPKFMELSPAAPPDPRECVLEFVKPSGAALRLRWRGSPSELGGALSQHFWETA